MYDNLKKLAAIMEKRAVGARSKRLAHRLYPEDIKKRDPVGRKRLAKAISQFFGTGGREYGSPDDYLYRPQPRSRSLDYANPAVIKYYDTYANVPPQLRNYVTPGYDGTFDLHTIFGKPVSKDVYSRLAGSARVVGPRRLKDQLSAQSEQLDRIAVSGRHNLRLIDVARAAKGLETGTPQFPIKRQTLYRGFKDTPFPRDTTTGRTWFTHIPDVAVGYGKDRGYVSQYNLKRLKQLGVVGPATTHIGAPRQLIADSGRVKFDLSPEYLRHVRRNPLLGESKLRNVLGYERVVIPKDINQAQSLGHMDALYKMLPSRRGLQQVYGGGIKTPHPVRWAQDLIPPAIEQRIIEQKLQALQTTPRVPTPAKKLITPKRVAGAGAAATGLALLPEAIKLIRRLAN